MSNGTSFRINQYVFYEWISDLVGISLKATSQHSKSGYQNYWFVITQI